jgi:hypothetical protein
MGGCDGWLLTNRGYPASVRYAGTLKKMNIIVPVAFSQGKTMLMGALQLFVGMERIL